MVGSNIFQFFKIFKLFDLQRQSWEHGGVEFPVTDFVNKFGKKADHFWACGFGSVMPDRVYHAEKSTGARWVYKVRFSENSKNSFLIRLRAILRPSQLLSKTLLHLISKMMAFYLLYFLP